MYDWWDGKLRYLIHFTGTGTGMRHYDAPLDEGDELTDCGERYRVVQVEHAPNARAFGRAWAVPTEG